MARPKLGRVRTNISVEEDIFDELGIYLRDPIQNKLRYGAISVVVNKLLRRWLEKLHEPNTDVKAFLEGYGVSSNPSSDETETETEEQSNAGA